jgi:hypothetical protein
LLVWRKASNAVLVEMLGELFSELTEQRPNWVKLPLSLGEVSLPHANSRAEGGLVDAWGYRQIFAAGEAGFAFFGAGQASPASGRKGVRVFSVVLARDSIGVGVHDRSSGKYGDFSDQFRFYELLKQRD